LRVGAVMGCRLLIVELNPSRDSFVQPYQK